MHQLFWKKTYVHKLETVKWNLLWNKIRHSIKQAWKHLELGEQAKHNIKLWHEKTNEVIIFPSPNKFSTYIPSVFEHFCIKLVIVWIIFLQAHLLKCTKTISSVNVPSYPCLVHLIQNLCLVTVKQILGCLTCILWINFYFCRSIPKKTKDQKSIITLPKRPCHKYVK